MTTKNFVLIDSSILDAGGHSLDYAKRVLRAAKGKGFRTVLAVNKDSEPISSEFVDEVLYAFSNTYWQNLKLGPKSSTPIMKIVRAYRDLRQLTSKGISKSFASARRFFQRRLPVHLAQSIFRIVTAMYRSLPRVRSLFRVSFYAFLGLVLLIFSPFIVAVFVVYHFVGSLRIVSLSRVYKSECEDVMRNIKGDSETVFFVPTLGETELKGILALGRNPFHTHWHLLFRREAAELGLQEDERESEISLIHRMSNKTGSVFRTAGLNDSLHFYCDTVPLAKDWSLRTGIKFEVLPIPCEPLFEFNPQEANNSAKIVTYLGDARAEKGFQHLPRVVKDIRAWGFGPEQVRFIIQSNFNTVAGDSECRVAKSELQSLTGSGVELLDGPFSTQMYGELLTQSDILILAYDEENYSLRSSGILAEAIYLGIPSLYPRKSWMGRAVGDVIETILGENDSELLAGTTLGIQASRISAQAGVEYDDVQQLSYSLLDALNDFDSLREKSGESALIWSRFHNSDTLIEHLLKNSQTK